tara:strand:- start:31951 stop:32160 length:210 start_codon:yes stop_codon:yes gene_type:complete
MKFVILVKWKKTNLEEVYPTLTSFLASHPIAPIDTINNYLSRKKENFETEDCIIKKLEINRLKKMYVKD